MKKFSLLAIIVLFLSSFLTSAASANKFPDLPTWANDEILYLNTEEVVTGYPDGKFGSTDTITRGDAALMLARAKKLDTKNIGSKPSFPDINKRMYYYEAIEAAVKAGYLNGYPNGIFGPKDTLTREQMAKIIVDAYNLKGTSGNSFTDTSKSWAMKEIESLAHNGISNGLPDGTFQPKGNITRAEFSVMLARAMNDAFKIKPEPSPHDLEEGTYSLPFEIKHETSDMDSVMADYVNPIGFLRVEDGKTYIALKLLESDWITDFKTELNGVLTSTRVLRTENNERIVEFEVENLTEYLNAWIELDIPDVYNTSHNVRFSFDPDSIQEIPKQEYPKDAMIN